MGKSVLQLLQEVYMGKSTVQLLQEGPLIDIKSVQQLEQKVPRIDL
jgi:hypothetical protein